MKLSTDCQPIVMHTLRIVIIGRFVFAFLTSNPPIFRVPPFNSDHGADAPHDRPMIAPWSPHDRPMIACTFTGGHGEKCEKHLYL